MTPLLCDSDFNKGADLSAQEPEWSFCETSLLISDQTQTAVWSLTSLPEAEQRRC